MEDKETVLEYIDSGCVGSDGDSEYAEKYIITRNGVEVFTVTAIKYSRGGRGKGGYINISRDDADPRHFIIEEVNWDSTEYYDSYDDGLTWRLRKK